MPSIGSNVVHPPLALLFFDIFGRILTMADLDYVTVQADSETLNRPNRTYAIKGQAGFLALALALRVPILSEENNVPADLHSAPSRRGLSSDVSRSIMEFKPELNNGFVNGLPTDWFQSTPDALTIRRHVTKRIATIAEADVDDARHLASITNEMRTLANRSLRRCRHIVALLFVSWNEMPDNGRFWAPAHA
jgi:hypothetical protein